MRVHFTYKFDSLFQNIQWNKHIDSQYCQVVDRIHHFDKDFVSRGWKLRIELWNEIMTRYIIKQGEEGVLKCGFTRHNDIM